MRIGAKGCGDLSVASIKLCAVVVVHVHLFGVEFEVLVGVSGALG